MNNIFTNKKIYEMLGSQGPAKPGVVKKVMNFLSDAYTRNVLKKGGKTHAESEATLAEMKAKKRRAQGQK